MTKWADYLISSVKYNPDGTHIVQVQRHTDTGTHVNAPEIVSRQTVVSNLKSGITYATIYQAEGGQWRFGEHIVIDVVNSVEYIKTVADGIINDNLGELPEF